MSKLILIVEGDGEVKAAPALVRRLLYEIHERYEIQIERPLKAGSNDTLLKVGGLEHFLELARRNPECMGALILLDCETRHASCPPGLATLLANRAKNLQLPFPVVIVCACCEYESWFLASLHTLRGKHDLDPEATFEGDPEQKCNAKEWLNRHMKAGKYKETIDQEKMTYHLDIPHLIENIRSFKRLAHAIEELIHAIDHRVTTITPLPEQE